ncbi:MAG: GAF domain-containing sensor histidine kinase [Pegethrix bostrychoides GSE-TBD4-15B]|jgi:signal transduction histidine kinase|uniref:histidine kinase n=1 Tax=Pegethrix bostrychoides GSE-TBD4-15B TaxID=2839662 RepID=A0A951PC42_9CYAN|nr:GAF domain-containing sensor histidine kinase [Pegethrix bostrychoides GSE-TBD4-15B]
MQPSRDTSIRAVPPLPKITDAGFAYSDSSKPELESVEAPAATIARLQQALELETLLRRIIEQIHISLEPDQILQTAVRELAIGLRVKGCNLALYDLRQGCSTLRYEWFHATNPVALNPVAVNHTVLIASQSDLYQQLLQRQSVQFCLINPVSVDQAEPTCSPVSVPFNPAQFTCLICPIQDSAGVLGDLRLFRPKLQGFSPEEVRLVQQVGLQCAGALRKAEIYRQSQRQISELEQMHQRKDEFLSTVSHELRTPMSNIKMAAQLVEINLDQLDSVKLTAAQRYLKILKDETSREVTLINDLLDLSRLEAGTDSLVMTTTNPVFWLPPILEPFMERAKLQQQQFQIDLATYLPSLTTDLGDLERVLSELLNNACKYTPAGERIVFSVRLLKASANARAPVFLFSVANSGIEIPETEQQRIFEKFYRLPNPNLSQQTGTGLGLSLVKGLVERLSGQLRVESYAGLTRFAVELPSCPPGER